LSFEFCVHNDREQTLASTDQII